MKTKHRIETSKYSACDVTKTTHSWLFIRLLLPYTHLCTYTHTRSLMLIFLSKLTEKKRLVWCENCGSYNSWVLIWTHLNRCNITPEITTSNTYGKTVQAMFYESQITSTLTYTLSILSHYKVKFSCILVRMLLSNAF